MKSRTLTSVLALMGALAVGASCADPAATALGTSEQCFNGADDDGDGLIDCDDPDCAGHYACDPQWFERLCGNGVDDDGDGLVDCDDPDCTEDQACNPHREVACADGLDNDGDGLVDCRDPDCAAADACRELCGDGEDNDGDGLVDCDDPDCAVKPRCQAEVCDNGLDDNENGLTDCEDPQCATAEACRIVVLPEICDDGQDNDGDGLLDCEDPDCAENPWCAEARCGDGLDNDGDGLVDCDDPDCGADPACAPSDACQPATPVYCGTHVYGTTEGRLSNFTSYPCASGSFPGGEVYHRFTAASTMQIVVTFANDSFSGDLRLMALGGTNAGCLPGGPCESDTVGPGTLRERTYDLSTGQTMYTVIDSAMASGGEYTLAIACVTGLQETACNDGLDNDSDGAVDCWDEDCLGSPHCGYWISAGLLCAGDGDCAPGEWCMHALVAGSPRQWGMCTKDCLASNPAGDQCWTESYGQGQCVMDPNGQEAQCLLPCGTSGGTTVTCPPSFLCTNLQTGDVNTVQSGFCVPYF